MPSDIKEIEYLALSLSTEDRGKLIRNLILSLENEDRIKNIEQQWINESKRRINDFKEGRTKGKPFSDAMSDVRERLI